MQTKNFTLYRNDNQAVQDAYSMLASNIHLGTEYKEINTLVITSCKPGEGKTSLAINLAMTMAEWGKKVLLIDADMRNPSENKLLGEQAVCGMSEVLNGEVEFNEALCSTYVDNLTYLPCGKSISNPMGLLCSMGFDNLLSKVKSKYDLVIFDTPSLSSVGDASFISVKMDATLLVAKMGKTDIRTLKRAKEQLEKVNANILGVVLNKVKKNDYKRYFETYNYFSDEKRFVKNKNAKSNLSVQV